MNIKGKIILLYVMFLSFVAVLYLVGSVISSNWNPFLWERDVKVLLVIFLVPSFLAVNTVAYELLTNKN